MKCEKCGNKIQYNKYVVYEGKVYCPDCDQKIITARIDEIVAKRAARKIKRSKRKKSKKSTESYNPFVGEE